tara:strand:+ start:379 stop:636 length:258 start_codon:yes stop_codon:yes gene_type:complete
MDPSVLEYGVVGVLIVIIYGLVDKVIIPIVRGKSANGQDFINRQTERRINRIEGEIGEVRTTVAEITRTVDLSQAILTRVEESLK